MGGKAKYFNKEISKWWIKNIVTMVVTAAVLFIASGKPAWIMAWLYLAGLFLVIIANARVMEGELLAERSRLQEGTQKWDIALSFFVALFGPLLTWMIAGFDVRFSWSAYFFPGLQYASLLMIMAGGLLGSWPI